LRGFYATEGREGTIGGNVVWRDLPMTWPWNKKKPDVRPESREERIERMTREEIGITEGEQAKGRKILDDMDAARQPPLPPTQS
jgi:hypothetical protein